MSCGEFPNSNSDYFLPGSLFNAKRGEAEAKGGVKRKLESRSPAKEMTPQLEQNTRGPPTLQVTVTSSSLQVRCSN
jgi:hypothetical protein